MVAAYEGALRSQGKSELTILSYREAFRQFVSWWRTETGTEFSPAAATVHDIRAYRGHLVKGKHAAPSTVNRKLAALASFYRVALGLGWATADPTVGVTGLKATRPAPRALDRKSLNRLLRNVYARGNKRDIAMLELMANTGIRVRELVNLTLDDLTLKERKGNVRVRSGKGELFRDVPLNGDVRAALRAYLAARPIGPSQALFPSQQGRTMVPSTAWRVVKGYGAAAEVELSPHTLRHTFGTRMVREQKADLVLVAKLMGHLDVNTTALYAQPTEDDLAHAVEGLAAS